MKKLYFLRSMLCLLMAMVCNVAWAQTPVLDLTADEIGTLPYELSEDDANKVFALTDLTVAVRVNPTTLNGRRALFCTSDPTQATNTEAMPTNSHYVAYGLNGADIGYLASCRNGDRYTKASGVSPGAEDVVFVFVINPTNNNFKAYANGSSIMDRNFGSYEIATPKMVKEDHLNAKIYIGGGVKSDNANFEVFDGAITGVKVFDGVLTAEQITGVFAPAFPLKVVVDGWRDDNPNTHFGNVKVGTTQTKLTLGHMATGEMNYNGIGDVIEFTRAYRGFDFQGYFLGEEELGESFTLTDELKTTITDDNPLVAKFTETDDVTLFYDDDEKSYRIPAIAKTSTDRLIAVSDYRHNMDDLGRDNHGTGTTRIDLVMRYSDDNGKTWSEKQTIAQGSGKDGADDCGYGDAAIAAVGEKVLVMAAAGDVCYPYASATAHNRTVRIFSEDNGKTWTKTDISVQMFIGENALIPNGHAAFFGSGRLAVDEDFNGEGNARIYGAMLVKNESATTNIFVIYTDDLGANWKILGGSTTPVANADEPKVEILPNGQILLSARRVGGRLFNVFTYGTGEDDKTNGVGTWGTAVNGCGNGGSNGTNGEVYCIDAQKADGTTVKLLLQSQPKGGSSQYDRKDVTIWYREVSASETYEPSTIASGWTQGIQVSTQQSSYSVMTMQADGKIAFFFEEAPCYGDDYTKGYCMVYVPLTVEAITKCNYYAKDTDLDATATINVVLTDAEGNTYTEQLTDCKVGEIAAKLAEAYPFIALGEDAEMTYDGSVYTYSNTVTLPFKVSNEETTVWHNIYWPSNGSSEGYPVYMSALSGDNIVKTNSEKLYYGESSLNTLTNADKISWALYQVGEDLSFVLKNKLTGKYVKTTSTATDSSGGSNVQFTDNLSEATEFTVVDGRSNGYRGEYALASNGGYLMVWGVNNGYTTYSTYTGHQGAWLKFAEVPDFESLIAEVNADLAFFGESLGQYTPADADAVATAKTAMENSANVTLNALNAYNALLDDATLNMPVDGQYFRVAYDYCGSVGKLYMQGVASSEKGVQFTEDTGSASIWVYYNGALYSYSAGKCLKEFGSNRGLQDNGTTTATFSASPRAKGKYNIACTSYVHANTNGTAYYTDHCSSNNCAAHDLILESVTMTAGATESIECTIGEYKIATFYANTAMSIPEGVEAYVATSAPVMDETAGTGIISMTKIADGIIPAQTGVVLRGEPDTYTFTSSNDAGATAVTGNLMHGYAGTLEYESVTNPTDGSVNYVLTVMDGQAGFYKKASGFKVYNNKAYLQVPAAASAARALYFNFDDDATGIVETDGETENEEIYDLAGRRVRKAVKGLYIVNGKKVLK